MPRKPCYPYWLEEKPQNELESLEKRFTLDCVSVSSLSSGTSKIYPKPFSVIPPYNAQKDKHAKTYFRSKGTQKIIRNSDQINGGCSINGKIADRLNETSLPAIYIKTRNKAGCGYSRETVSGHARFMSNVPPIVGWNGEFGFRRNTPDLLKHPSVFDHVTRPGTTPF
ncbi:Uncharacterized protein C17orf98 [Trichoplax sp. H2]|uniref:Uncharacterized protein n=1 Tax=Trichoplax adhaerens TaxID=10228 RepID=B3RPI0_TRIAD|nr:hypothetical protein TRIADDRAFT_53550 [Trichoplax adhaerens]EDV27640.1 hypothetical protein TRIADDRAFT_53550 [Trichoplax adhaerens]RDD45255.1 Uncharacterized protein C17orf98 [Trichoplax sp. H2]|eukprot:XP_002109474.1 hypothetical protein TRIADDRAFT_53550 [Trichoplax adhaerens]